MLGSRSTTHRGTLLLLYQPVKMHT